VGGKINKRRGFASVRRLELSDAVQIVESIISEVEVEIRDGARADLPGVMPTVREAWELIKRKLAERGSA